MEEMPKRNSDFERLDIFTGANHYLVLFFGLSCLLGSILLQEIFLAFGQYRLGITVASLCGIILPIFFLTRRFPAGFRAQVRILSPEIGMFFRVAISSLMVVIVIDYVYLISQHIIPVSDDFVESLIELKPVGARTYIITFIGLCIAVPMAEELLFRGVIQQIFSLNMNPVFAFVLTGVLFGVVHLSAHLLISIVVFGTFLGYIFYTTNNLTYAMVAHSIFNTVSFLQLALTTEEKLKEPPFYAQHTWMLVVAVVVLTYLLVEMKKGATSTEAPGK